MSKFLDLTGLTHFYEKLKEKFIKSDLSNLSNGSIDGTKLKASTITEDKLAAAVVTKLNSSGGSTKLKALHVELNTAGDSVDYDGTSEVSFGYGEIVNTENMNNAFNGYMSIEADYFPLIRINEADEDSTQGITIFEYGENNDPSIIINSSGINSKNGFYETSDERKKNFSGDIKIDFNKLKTIPKKYFTWKSDKENKLNIGTSAQEVQKVYPELVKDHNGELSVDYAKLSIVALAAVDKLNEEIELLKKEIEVLKSK